MIDRELLAILACPLCDERPPLEQRGEYLVCTRCGHGFPVVDDIPQLLPEDAVSPESLKEPSSGSEPL